MNVGLENLSYEEWPREFNLPTLEARRKRENVIMMYNANQQ